MIIVTRYTDYDVTNQRMIIGSIIVKTKKIAQMSCECLNKLIILVLAYSFYLECTLCNTKENLMH